MLCAGTLQAREWEVIRLDYVSDGVPYSTIRVLSNHVEPNSISTTDTYRLEIDGRDIDLPFNFIRNLNMMYRAEVAYDLKTGGVVHTRHPNSCPGFNPSKEGKELSVR